MDSQYDKIGFQDGVSKDNNIITYLHRHVELFPDRKALQWLNISSQDKPSDHASVSYAELVSQISRIALGLRELGIGKGDRVLIFLPMSVPMYSVMFAVQQIGAAAVFLDSWARRDQLSVSAEIVTPKAMISFEKAFELTRAIVALDSVPIKIVTGPATGEYTATLEALLALEEEREIEPVAGDDTALITFTTGSSGRPKGANRTHRFLASQHRALNEHLPYTESDVDLPYFPIFSLNNLAGGVNTVLPAVDLAHPSEHDATQIATQIQNCSVTCCTLSPAIFHSVAKHCLDNEITLSGLRRAVTGGAPVSMEMVKAFMKAAPNAEVQVLYGSTEVEPIAHILGDEMLALKKEQKGVCVGHIDTGLRYKFIKIKKDNIDLSKTAWDKLEVDEGSPGELIVCGDHVCGAYYNDAEATERAKIYDADGSIWHRTGDVGVLDSEGHLWLMGRVHNTIIRDDQFFFPVHAELVLQGLSFVAQAAFLGLPDPKLGERTCAVVTLGKGEDVTNAEKCIADIRMLLDESNIVTDDIQILEEIPMDPRHHSKVEYTLLREMLTS